MAPPPPCPPVGVPPLPANCPLSVVAPTRDDPEQARAAQTTINRPTVGKEGEEARRARPWCCLFRCCREGGWFWLWLFTRELKIKGSQHSMFFFTMVVVGCLAIVERRGSSGFSPVIPRSSALSNVFSDPGVSAGNVCLPEKRVGAQ